MKGLFFSDTLINKIRNSATNAEARKVIGQVYNDKSMVNDPLLEYLLYDRNIVLANHVGEYGEWDMSDIEAEGYDVLNQAFYKGADYGRAAFIEHLLEKFYSK